MIGKSVIFKPSKENLNLYVILGGTFFVLGLLDVISNSLFEANITSFLPLNLSFFTPILFGLIGLHLIRIEFSGNKILDSINKNINSNWFNAFLTLLVIFILIKMIPGLLNWLFFDADFVGTAKEECSREGACWIFVYVWLERFIYGLYPNEEIWRINLVFLTLIISTILLAYSPDKLKKYFPNHIFDRICRGVPVRGPRHGGELLTTTAPDPGAHL